MYDPTLGAPRASLCYHRVLAALVQWNMKPRGVRTRVILPVFSPYLPKRVDAPQPLRVKIGNPAAVGLGGFALTTFVLQVSYDIYLDAAELRGVLHPH
jgi:hypothetical protein